jgi:hypothetical protein
VNLLMPIGMLIAGGLWLAVVTTLTAYALLAGLALFPARRVPGLMTVADGAA